MWWKELRRYLGIFLLGAVLIAVYKTFDNFGAILSFGKKLWNLLTPFIIGGCIAYVLHLPSRKIEALCQKTKSSFLNKHRRPIAVIAIYLIFFAAITLLLFSVVPALTKSVSDFISQLPSLLNNFFAWLNSLGIYGLSSESVMKFLNEHIFSLDKLIGNFTPDNMNRYAKGVISIGTAFFDTFMGIIISIYLLFDRSNLKKGFMRICHLLFPEKFRSKVGKYGVQVDDFINAYLYCQLLDALIIFVLSFIILSLLGTKYALLLAVIMGTFNLIPYFGAIFATILVATVTAFTKNFTAGLIVAAAMIVLQQIDSNFIQPRLVNKSLLQLSPVWVILAVVLGGGFFGALGIFLTVPAFALIRTILADTLNTTSEPETVTAPADTD